MILKKHFRHFYLRYGITFLLGIAVLVTVNIIQLRIPVYLNRIITYLQDNAENNSLTIDSAVIFITPIVLSIAGIVILIFIGRFLWRFTLIGASRRIEEDLRNDMFTHATKLPQSFYATEKTGGLMTLFTNDLEAVRNTYGWGTLMLVDSTVLGTLVLIRMFSIDWLMTLLAFVPLLIVAGIALVLVTKMQARFKERQEAVEELSDFTQENLSGINIVKAYVREKHEINQFNDKTDKLYKKDLGFIKYSIVINVALVFTISIIVVSIIVFGSYQIVYNQENPGANNMTAGLLSEYVTYFFTLIWPVLALAQFFFFNAQGQASAKRIKEFLDAPIEIKDQENLKSVPQLSGEIVIKNLTFTYPDGESPVLDNVSFNIKAGQMVGVLGKTGSGKSSLVELLLRVYNTNKGMVFFDKTDILEIPIKQLRNQIGYVPQDNFLYSDTITNNIGFSYDDPNQEIVENAAQLADVYTNIVEFKEGFETVLGERGVTVSGGQKQRISIARALAKDPQILILDDSVSAVDTKTEEAIISNLKRVRQNKTTIIIAHRISTVKKMDKIILLDHGKLVGVGTHDELLETNPIYQDMVKRQALERLVEEGITNERF